MHNLYNHIKKYGLRRHPIYTLGVMIFFFNIFDGIISYISPLILNERGLSDTWIGIIIGTSSIFGALFDFIFCRFVKNITFRRIFLFMFFCCLLCSLILWRAKIIVFFILAMAMWGIYYDLYNYGTFDFVGRYTKKNDHSLSFGVIQVFKSLGLIIAPIIAGIMVVAMVTFKVIALAWIFLAIAIVFFCIIIFQTKKNNFIGEARNVAISHKRISIMLKIIKAISPILVTTAMLYMAEAFFWTLGPLYAEELRLGQWSGLLVTFYWIPAVFLGWYVGNITNKFGKEMTAYMNLLLGSLALFSFMILGINAFVILGLTFLAACFLGLSMPAVNSLYADFISENPQLEGEIEAAEDFFTNVAYVIGPIMAGIMADAFGYKFSFSLLGAYGIVMSIILFKLSAKRTKIKIDQFTGIYD